jgi:hypothetical protein
MSDHAKFAEIYDYLEAPVKPGDPTGTLVFGRHDVRLAQSMGGLASKSLAPWFVISGNLGKDSGELWETGTPEAGFIAAEVLTGDYDITPGMIHVETEALTGEENARFGLRKMAVLGLEHRAVTALAHATSLRRLAASVEHEGAGHVETVYRVPTDYPFDPSAVKDQLEAAAELLRLADWPARGWLPEQADLPENLVDFARHVTDTPPRIPTWQLNVLRHLPIRLRKAVILK